jgi:uncharacterized repeat protein (TIGR01451 family)
MTVKKNLAFTLIQRAKIGIGLIMPEAYGRKALSRMLIMVALLCLGSWGQTAWAASCTVTNTLNTGAGSLRDCITTANGSANSTISFNIPVGDSGHLSDGTNHRWRITPTSALPTITADGTIIDGATQALNNPSYVNTLGPEIELYGNNADFSGLTISSSNNTIKGLIIGKFNSTPFLGSPANGILIGSNGGTNNTIQGNYIGVDYTGMASLNNGVGVYIDDGNSNTTVGGTAAGAANIIAYNDGAGIEVNGMTIIFFMPFPNASLPHTFSANSIFSNGGKGIVLDDAYSNNNKSAPTLGTLTPSGGNLIVTALVPAGGDTIQFFRANNSASPSVTPDASGGEGYLFLGSCVDNGGACVGPYVTGADTNGASGQVSVTLTGVATGDTLSATATDAANGTSPFSANKVAPVIPFVLNLIKQTYDLSGQCIASSDATDAGCGSTSVINNIPAGTVLKFMIIVKNTTAASAGDVRFQDNLDESASGFSYIPGSMTSTPVGASAPADTATNAVIYAAATIALTDAAGDDKGSARDLVGAPNGADNISIGSAVNTALSIDAHKSFAVIFQARKK